MNKLRMISLFDTSQVILFRLLIRLPWVLILDFGLADEWNVSVTAAGGLRRREGIKSKSYAAILAVTEPTIV